MVLLDLAVVAAASDVAALTVVSALVSVIAAASNLEAESAGNSISRVRFIDGIAGNGISCVRCEFVSSRDVGFSSGSGCIGFRSSGGIVYGGVGETFSHMMAGITIHICW